MGSGDIEYGTCEICGKKNTDLIRTYYRYEIKCECHAPFHFVMVRHCKDCIPKEPEYTNVHFRTDQLKEPINLVISIIQNSSCTYNEVIDEISSVILRSDFNVDSSRTIAERIVDNLIREKSETAE